MSRLKDLYKNEIVDAMMKKFGYKNVMQVPKLDKIVINMGVGEADSSHGDAHETFQGEKFFGHYHQILSCFIFLDLI